MQQPFLRPPKMNSGGMSPGTSAAAANKPQAELVNDSVTGMNEARRPTQEMPTAYNYHHESYEMRAREDQA
jgi:hypothetical protein